jgi:hypothetical protein
MPDFMDDALEDFQASLDDDTGSADFGSSTREPDFLGLTGAESQAERLEILRALAASGGPRADIAAELVQIAEERAAKQQREAQIAVAEAAGADLDDPAVQDGLRADVYEQRELANESYLRQREANLRSRYDDATVAVMMETERAAMAQIGVFETYKRDPLFDHPAWRAREAADFEQDRARQAAARTVTLEQRTQLAQDEIQATRLAVLMDEV